MKTALEAAGSDLDHVLKCNVHVHLQGPLQDLQRDLQALLPDQSAGAVFFCVPEWTGPFDIEIDCIALTKS